MLVGTKYDAFEKLDPAVKEDTTTNARKFAKAMKAPVIFCSAADSVNVAHIFKLCLSKVFDLNCTLDKCTDSNSPVLDY
jgi:Gtp-binding protein of the ras superfamily involved in termination of M-phase